jgi:NitT/TauT family transport system substrate-binding protein
MRTIDGRRRFLAGLAASGAASLIGLPKFVAVGHATAAGDEPPPETTTIRLPAIPSPCTAPLYVAEELLHEEGFAEVEYVESTVISAGLLADRNIDISAEAPGDYLHLLDADRPLKVLAGIHTGCLELRAGDDIQSIADLRGKRVGITAVGANDQVVVSVMAAYVGLDPTSEIEWVTNSSVRHAELFAAGEIDAFVGGPPEPQQSCMEEVGHVVVNIAEDKPWSQYFCCMVTANADFMRENPVATKRALRAILKATDIVHRQPERAAQRMAEVGFSHDCAHMHMTPHHAQFGHWREYDPEDTVRFFALRLHEVGMIKKTPNEIISQFTDWRLLNEIKRELET